MTSGIVKWFNQTKGYGFITVDNCEQDAFVHITTLKKSGIETLLVGQKVSFDLFDNQGRASAKNLQLLPPL